MSTASRLGSRTGDGAAAGHARHAHGDVTTVDNDAADDGGGEGNIADVGGVDGIAEVGGEWEENDGGRPFSARAEAPDFTAFFCR